MTLYAIRNKDGKWFKEKGRKGSALSWTDSIQKAKLFSKMGQAKSKVSFFVNKYPELGEPEIVELYVSMSKVIFESHKVGRVHNKRAESQAEYAKKLAEIKLDMAEKALEEVTEKLKQSEEKCKENANQSDRS